MAMEHHSRNAAGCAAKKSRETSAEKRARKAQVLQLQDQAKFVWAGVGGVLFVIFVAVAIMAQRSKSA